METDLVGEVVIAADGRYLLANDVALTQTGYTLEEFTRLRVGDLSPSTQADSVAEVWADLVAGRRQQPLGRLQILRRKDGSTFRAITLGIAPGKEADTFVSRWGALASDVIGGDRPDPVHDRPLALHHILAQWRDAERQLAQLEGSGAARLALEREVEAFRNLYQTESEQRSSAEVGTGS